MTGQKYNQLIEPKMTKFWSAYQKSQSQNLMSKNKNKSISRIDLSGCLRKMELCGTVDDIPLIGYAAKFII